MSKISLSLPTLVFSLLVLTGCEQKELTQEDQAKLPTLAEVQGLCASYHSRDVNVSVTNIPLLEKTTTIVAEESNRCPIRAEIQIAEQHSHVLSSGTYAELSGAAMGLKVAGIEIKNMNAQKEGLRGRYFQMYRDNEYVGLAYSSYVKGKSLLFMIFGLAQAREEQAFELIRAVEERNLPPLTEDS